jgi:uridine kinase
MGGVSTLASVLSQLADAIEALRLGHPTRVGIDGRSAAGKTTFATALAATLRRRGREVVRAEIDDFHRPGHKWRSINREWTPQLYYDEGYDYATFARLVLEPLGPGGTRRCRTRLLDSFHDELYPEEWVDVPADAVAVVDGAFLLRREMALHWDYLAWLDIDFETMVSRARERDVAWVGEAAKVERRYREHWIPTHQLYESLEHPADRADFVIDTNDWAEPRIVGQRGAL